MNDRLTVIDLRAQTCVDEPGGLEPRMAFGHQFLFSGDFLEGYRLAVIAFDRDHYVIPSVCEKFRRLRAEQCAVESIGGRRHPASLNVTQ